MSEKLKPCPFCGSEAQIYGSWPMFKIHCLVKGCVILPSMFFNHFTSESEAAKAWNTRAGEAAD